MRLAPIATGYMQTLCDEATDKKNVRTKVKMGSRQARYAGRREVWSLALAYGACEHDVVSIANQVAEALDTVDPDRTGRNMAEAAAAVWERWSPSRLHEDPIGLYADMLGHTINNAWSVEVMSEDGTTGGGVNIYKVRQRTSTEEWWTAQVETWCAAIHLVGGPHPGTAFRYAEKILQTIGVRPAPEFWAEYQDRYRRMVSGT